jgi:hypothetical protein
MVVTVVSVNGGCYWPGRLHGRMLVAVLAAACSACGGPHGAAPATGIGARALTPTDTRPGCSASGSGCRVTTARFAGTALLNRVLGRRHVVASNETVILRQMRD